MRVRSNKFNLPEFNAKICIYTMAHLHNGLTQTWKNGVFFLFLCTFNFFFSGTLFLGSKQGQASTPYAL